MHALAQVAHVDLAATLPPATLVARVNDALPHDINVLAAERVPPRFHARHSAVARSYLYQIARRRTAFAKPFVWWVKEPLDVDEDAGRGRERSRASATSARSPTTTRTRSRRAWPWTTSSIDVARRAAPRARRRIALSLEDGAPARRRARRRRPRRDLPPGQVARLLTSDSDASREAHRAGVGPVSRARVLRGRSARYRRQRGPVRTSITKLKFCQVRAGVGPHAPLPRLLTRRPRARALRV